MSHIYLCFKAMTLNFYFYGLFVWVFGGYWSLNSGHHACTLPLEHHPQLSICFTLTPPKKCTLYQDSVQTFTYIIGKFFRETYYMGDFSVLYCCTLFCCFLFHSFTILAHIFQAFWDTDSNASSSLWRWPQETPVDWGGEIGKVRKPMQGLLSSRECEPCLRVILPRGGVLPPLWIEDCQASGEGEIISWYFWPAKRAPSKKEQKGSP
jgi:hypothetical protein